MKKIVLTLLCISSLFAEVKVLDSFSILDNKKVPKSNNADYNVSILCIDGYKYTIFTKGGSSISSVQNMKLAMPSALPIQCNNN